MNFIWVIIGVVYLIYQFYKEHKGEGYFTVIFAFLGIIFAVIAVPQLIGLAVGGETGQFFGRIVGLSLFLILIIVFYFYGRS